MYVWLNHFAVQQKLTQHCKSTIYFNFLRKEIWLLFSPLTSINGEINVCARLNSNAFLITWSFLKEAYDVI